MVELRSGKEFLEKKADANKIEHTTKRRKAFFPCISIMVDFC